MQDRVSLYPGRVKLAPVSGQENTYDMVRADSPTQDGTPLNKDSLLKDATAALFGLGSDAVPDDVLALLSRFNSNVGEDYLWEKVKTSYIHVESTVSTSNVISGIQNGGSITDYDSVESGQNGIVLTGEHKITVSTSSISTLVGKYYKNSSGVIYKISGGSFQSGKYYGNGYKVSEQKNEEHIAYLNSSNEEAYPPSESDGYDYIYRGKIGQVAMVATGTYFGTGTYGSGNKSVIALPFNPKIVFIFKIPEYQNFTGSSASYFGYSNQVFYNGATSFGAHTGSSSAVVSYSMENNALTRYSTAANVQMNESGQAYGYIAIG